MNDELSHHDPQELKAASKDITPVMRGWSYESGVINVRKIHGADGSAKVQMRLDLGLLQMEMTGRPDGVRPHGFESLLHYVESQLAEYRDQHGGELGFQISDAQCASLREEAAQYYYRYLSFFVLEEFSGVVRDTARNLRVLDLCGQFAEDEHDRVMLEQYRPYIIMMNARARASLLQQDGKLTMALAAIEEGLEDIKQFFARFDQEEAYSRCHEVRMLRQFARGIRKKLPVNPMTRLRRKLDKAVKGEHYEEAARLRDKIIHMQRAHPRGGGENPAHA